MKKLYILILMFISSVTFGQALLTENFDYGAAAGDLTTVSGGNWVNHSGATPILYVTTSLSMANYPASGVGGSATIGSNAEDAHLIVATQTTGTIYLSGLINVSAAGSGTYFFHLYADSFGYRARVGVKDNGSGKILFGIGASSSTLTYGTTAFDLNTTYLVVASYEISTGKSNLYVLNSTAATEPTTPEATDTGTLGTSITGVTIRQASGGPTATIDGIRMATTWTDIMTDAVAAVGQDNIDGFALYPNPVRNNIVNIQSQSSAEKNISIYDVIGKQVYQKSTSAKQINISQLKTGVYFVKVLQDGKIATRKLVKE